MAVRCLGAKDIAEMDIVSTLERTGDPTLGDQHVYRTALSLGNEAEGNRSTGGARHQDRPLQAANKPPFAKTGTFLNSGHSHTDICVKPATHTSSYCRRVLRVGTSLALSRL